MYLIAAISKENPQVIVSLVRRDDAEEACRVREGYERDGYLVLVRCSAGYVEDPQGYTLP